MFTSCKSQKLPIILYSPWEAALCLSTHLCYDRGLYFIMWLWHRYVQASLNKWEAEVGHLEVVSFFANPAIAGQETVAHPVLWNHTAIIAYTIHHLKFFQSTYRNSLVQVLMWETCRIEVSCTEKVKTSFQRPCAEPDPWKTACYYPSAPVKPCDSFGQLISNIHIITEINTGYSRTERSEKNFFCKLEVGLFIRELPTILWCSVSATKLHNEKGLL